MIHTKELMIASVGNYLSSFAEDEEDESAIFRILDAMQVVDRSYFVEDKDLSYVDSALPIKDGQTISQPSTVGRMLMLADIQSDHKILEVGLGSGWNAALLSYLCFPGKVESIEVSEKLYGDVRKRYALLVKIKQLKPIIKNIMALHGNVFLHKGAYDRVIMTAGISYGQEDLIKDLAKRLLRDEGLLICPYQNGPLIIMKKMQNSVIVDYTEEKYAFVPLKIDI